MDMLIWILFGAIAALIIMIVLLIMYFIWPTLKSPGRFFMEAKRKNRPVCFLDAGSHWIPVIGTNKEQEGFIRDKFENVITVTPNSLKYCQGVLMGVGENYRSILMNPAIFELIKLSKDNKLNSTEVKAILGRVEKELEVAGYVVATKEKK